MDRRTFFKTSLGAGALPILFRPQTELIPTGLRSSLFSGRQSVATPVVFPLSVGSGDPQPNGIVLWTRLSPDAVPTRAATATVAWQISRTPNFEARDIALQGVQDVSAAGDFTARVVLSNPALQPWTTYYYRFAFEGVLSNTGRFKTLPAADMQLPMLRLGYISCQDYSNGYYTALAALAQEPVDYIVHLGDYIYETVSLTGSVRELPPLPSGGPLAVSLADYRHIYRSYRADPALQRLHENFAFLQIWDDHEFGNDAYQNYHPDDLPNREDPKPELRQAANQAWSEYAATAIPFDPSLDPLHSLRIYRSFRFGSLADLVFTDERLYRDGPPCGLDFPNRYVTSGCPEMQNPARTMLGETQRKWFIDRMNSSSATWKLWGNEVMNMALKVVNGTKDVYVTLDSWDGYPAERTSVLNSLSSVNNLVALTGDIHSFVAGYMKPSYDSGPQPRVGVEFVTGSVSSANFVELLASLKTSRTTSASAQAQLLNQAFPGGVLSLTARVMNPELVFFNSDTHGYSLLEITPESMSCAMKSVSTVREPEAAVSTLASFVVPAGQKRIIRT